MFIPTIKNKIILNDTVILTTDLKVTGGFFTKGHKFKVIGIYNEHKTFFSDIINDDGNIINKVNIKILTKIIPYKEAKKIQEKINYKKEVLNFIEGHCKNKTFEMEGRDTYDACKLKKDTPYRFSICNPKYSCIIYSEEAKKEYPTILRYIKIKKIEK